MKDALRRHGVHLAAALLTLGHFAPWAWHKTAALTLSAHELATFANFTPNAGGFFNEGYMLPLWAAALLVAAISAGSAHGRWSWLLFALLVASLGLPGYPELRKLASGQASEFLAQALIGAAVLLACLAVAVLRSDPLRSALFRATVLAAVPAAVAPLAGFLSIRNSALAPLFGDAVGLGWGWWLTAFSVFLLTGVAFVTIFPLPPSTRPPRVAGETTLLTRRPH